MTNIDEMTDDQLQAIRARADAATAGPLIPHRHKKSASPLGEWLTVVPEYEAATEMQSYESFTHGAWVGRYSGQRPEADCVFDAHARQDVPDLLDEVERLKKGNGTLTDQLGDAERDLMSMADDLQNAKEADDGSLDN